MKQIRIALILFTLVFGVLFAVRLGVIDYLRSVRQDKTTVQETRLSDKDVWMNVFQGKRKIGYSHSRIFRRDEGLQISEALFLRINTMGLAQDLNVTLNGTLSRDLALSKFDVNIHSGVFQFKARGRVVNNTLMIQTDTDGQKGHIKIPLKEKLFLTAGVMQTVADRRPAPGETYLYTIFDPATLTVIPVVIKAISREDVTVMNQVIPSTKIAVTLKGATQYSWIDDNGDVLIEEGVLGMRLEKTFKQDALHGMPIQAGPDVAALASVASNVVFDAPADLKMLKVRISGISFNSILLEGDRQSVSNDLVMIQKEVLTDLPKLDAAQVAAGKEKAYLIPSMFVQSDHPDIINTMTVIVSQDDAPFVKARKIINWIQQNIKKQPVLSLPDALSTLKNRIGDCNEHAVLAAALLRAAGIPARVESGLVYMDGRFYYHAWNRMYLGKWITADSVFGQIPADVTHIRFSIGAQEAQVDLLSLLGRVSVEVVDYK